MKCRIDHVWGWCKSVCGMGLFFSIIASACCGETNIVGTYASPVELHGFQSAIVSIASNSYAAWFESDSMPPDADRPIRASTCVFDNGHLYIVPMCILSEWIIKNQREPFIVLQVQRWTPTNIEGTSVLMRDDALDAWLNEHRLNARGLLIKVSDVPVVNSDKVKYPSVKVLERSIGKPEEYPSAVRPQ